MTDDQKPYSKYAVLQRQTKQESPKSSAQVETLVIPRAVIPMSGELKLNVKRPSPLTLRASENQKAIIRAKARAASVTVNHFVLAAALNSDYKPPRNPELIKALLAANRELTAQGNNLNQIAKHMNSSQARPDEGNSLLAIIVRSMLNTHKAVREALAGSKTYH